MNQGPQVKEFIETFLTLGGSFYGEEFQLLPFQEEILEDIYALEKESDLSSRSSQEEREDNTGRRSWRLSFNR